MSIASQTVERIHAWDLALCERLNRRSRQSACRAFFRTVSRLGDGVFWYALWMSLLMAYGREAVLPVLHIALTGLVCTGVYKLIKGLTLRPRPYTVHQAIQLGAAPLDHFSFPSGHTLHAVSFTVMLAAYFPGTAWLCAPFAALVALSRPVLGLHYPTDVLAGAVLGACIASGSLALV